MPMKVVGAAMNRGPLAEGSAPEPMPLPQYVFCHVLPISAFHPSTDPGLAVKSRPRMTGAGVFYSFAAHVTLLVAVVQSLDRLGGALPRLPRDLLHALALHCFVATTVDGPGFLAVKAAGLECDPHHDLPFLATGVAPFWAKWNLVVGDLLRAVVFEPVSEGRAVRRPAGAAGGGAVSERAPGRRLAGVVASFVVSAAMHEWTFWVLTGGVHGGGGHFSPGLRWFWFFSVQVSRGATAAAPSPAPACRPRSRS